MAIFAKQGDERALLAQNHFGDRYDDHYMQRTPVGDDVDDDEPIVIDEDAPGHRTTVDILCLSIGFLGVRPLPAECDVIIMDDEVFVAGDDEYLAKFSPV